MKQKQLCNTREKVLNSPPSSTPICHEFEWLSIPYMILFCTVVNDYPTCQTIESHVQKV